MSITEAVSEGTESRTCKRIASLLAERVGRTRFERYFRDNARLELGPEGVTVRVTSPFYASWLSSRFAQPLAEVARAETGRMDLPVRWRVDRGAAPAAPARVTSPATSGDRAGPGVAPAPRRKPSKPGPARHTLETFIVGESNRLAHRSALTLLDTSEERSFSALVVHGECGVGKTHLLQGLAHRAAQQWSQARVRCITADEFTSEYVIAVRQNTVEKFKARCRKLDLLCIDDVHLLAGRTSTQSALLQTFDALEMAGARIAIASDEHPSNLKDISERLISRCNAGMVVEIGAPDGETRCSIVQSLARRRGLELTSSGAAAIAEGCPGSVRELAGAVVRLDALVRLLPDQSPRPGPVPMTVVRKALEPTSSPASRRPVRVEQILHDVCAELGVEPSEIRGKSRHKRVVLARSLVVSIARRLTTRSFPEIAADLGRRNHSTAITACRRLEGRIERDERAEELEERSHLRLRDLRAQIERQIQRS